MKLGSSLLSRHSVGGFVREVRQDHQAHHSSFKLDLPRRTLLKKSAAKGCVRKSVTLATSDRAFGPCSRAGVPLRRQGTHQISRCITRRGMVIRIKKFDPHHIFHKVCISCSPFPSLSLSPSPSPIPMYYANEDVPPRGM